MSSDLDPEDALTRIVPEEHRSSIDHSADTEHYHDEDEDLHEGTGEDEQLESPFEDEDKDQGDDDISQDESGSGADGQTSRLHPAPQKRVNEASTRLSHIDLDGGPATPGKLASDPEGDIASNLRLTHEADRKKGRAVSRQIALWDTLLDARIQLQKAVAAANQLPLPSEAKSYVSHPLARDPLDSLLDVAGDLTEELFSLQEDLLRLNESREAPARKRRKVEREIDSDPVTSHSLGLWELSRSASVLEASYHPWVVDTLSKWSAKVQAVAPSVLLPDTRGSFLRDKGSQKGVVSLIDEVFRADGPKLLDRTKKQKESHPRVGVHRSKEGHGAVDEGDSDAGSMDLEAFDDMDYYQQLLRDVIAARGGSEGQAGEAQWQQSQRDRRARRKKAVDTKASKGRKLRYEVHAKLQNFMVPVPAVGSEWHEGQIDGLFSSLLQP